MHLRRSCCHLRRGFTLVELLVVMAIIAVLVSILMPTFHSVREQARMALCRAHLKNLHQGFMAYSQDHRGRFARNNCGGSQNYDGRLSRGWINGNYIIGTNAVQGITTGLIFPYVREIKVYLCPTQRLSPDAKGNVYVRSYSLADYLGRPRNNTISYKGIVNEDTGTTPFPCAEAFNQVLRPGQTLMLVEDNGEDGYYDRTGGNNIVLRHNSKGNIVFVDGHGESLNQIAADQAYESFFRMAQENQSSAGGS